MVRIRVVGGKYHKKAFDQMNEHSIIELVHESTNSVNGNATMVLADRNHVGYISEEGGKKCLGNDEFRKRFNNNVDNLKCVLDKKYTNIAYIEVIDMNMYSFEIHKMTNEQIRELGNKLLYLFFLIRQNGVTLPLVVLVINLLTKMVLNHTLVKDVI